MCSPPTDRPSWRINGAHSDAADTLFWYISMRTWIPVYVLFLVVLKVRWGWRGLLWALPVVAAMLLLAIRGSVMLFRTRCTACGRFSRTGPAGAGAHREHYLGGPYGFVSSHAANHFAIAVFDVGALQLSAERRSRRCCSGRHWWPQPHLPRCTTPAM